MINASFFFRSQSILMGRYKAALVISSVVNGWRSVGVDYTEQSKDILYSLRVAFRYEKTQNRI